MRYKPRLIAERLKRMVEQFPVVVVSGARQVGKSTLLAHALEGWRSVVLDPTVDVAGAREDPDLFLDNHAGPLVLDEIQYAPELVGAIKRRVDRDRRPGQFVLTGSQQWSQQWSVLRSASESLAGRAMFLDLEGFSLSEIVERPTAEHWLARYLGDADRFTSELGRASRRLELPRTLYEQLWRGFLPEADALDAEWIPDFHRAYVRTYVERDVRLLADVADWQQFGRFVRLAAALTAQEVNRSQFGRDIGTTPQTAERWLSILRSTFQWTELPPYHGNTVKRISGRPKGHISDTGTACSLQAISTPETLSGHPLAGPLFESAVVSEVRKLASVLPAPPTMYHWRSHGGAELDLLLERDGRLHPIEIKLTTRPTKRDASGVAQFRETYPDATIAPGLVIAPVEEPRKLAERVWVIPWDLV